MAGVGEASAIVGLVATAAQLSKAVIDIAGKYKDAKKQIESFGHEVAILGNILDQMYRLLGRDHLERDAEVYSILATIVDQCGEFFSELDVYKDTLYSRQGSMRNLTLRGKTKWVFEAAELEYLRARLESMKTSMLLMMTMQCMHSSDRFESHQAMQENARQIELLALQSDACVKRLESLEEQMTIPARNQGKLAIDRMSIMTTDTARSARSTTESIMSLYGHQSYYQLILDPREGEFDMAPEMLVDHSRISMIIEDCLHSKDTATPLALRDLEQRNINVEELAGGQRSESSFDSDAEATESLWNQVHMHKNPRRSTPSEESDTSTVITRASNIISIAFIPGVTAPKAQATLLNKPLPSHLRESGSLDDAQTPEDIYAYRAKDRPKPLPLLPRETGSLDGAQTPERWYPYRAKAFRSYATAKASYSYTTTSYTAYVIDFEKGEILEISDDTDVNATWWNAKRHTGETGVVPSNCMILL